MAALEAKGEELALAGVVVRFVWVWVGEGVCVCVGGWVCERACVAWPCFD